MVGVSNSFAFLTSLTVGILGYASARLRGDREVVRAAVERCGVDLKYASSALQLDKDICLTAVRHSADAIKFVAKGLKADPGEPH